MRSWKYLHSLGETDYYELGYDDGLKYGREHMDSAYMEMSPAERWEYEEGLRDGRRKRWSEEDEEY